MFISANIMKKKYNIKVSLYTININQTKTKKKLNKNNKPLIFFNLLNKQNKKLIFHIINQLKIKQSLNFKKKNL